MHSKQISFFSTTADLDEVLSSAGRERPFKLIKAGLFAEVSPLVLPSFDLLTASDHYLIIDNSLDVEVRRVPQRNGSVRFAIDQLKNAKSVVVRPGGLVGDGKLLVGQLGTSSSDKDSLKLYRLIHSRMLALFIKKMPYYVGRNALRLYNEGVRLVHGMSTPDEYDFKFSDQ